MPELTPDRIRRYSRHILLPEVGGVGQKRLLAAAVEVEVGPAHHAEIAALAYLAAAGVGCLLLSGDATGAVTARELAAGLLYGASDVGAPRVRALAARIAAINPDVRVALADDAPGAPARTYLAPLPGGAAAWPWLGAADAAGEEELACALVRGGLRAMTTLIELAAPRPA